LTFYPKNDTLLDNDMPLGKLLLKTIFAGLALYLSSILFSITIPSPTNNFKEFGILCLTIGLINYIIRPILKIVSFPINLLTFGLFGLIINLGLIYALDAFFPSLQISGFWQLFNTTLAILIFDALVK
jgi:putative membrane protein